ncbi:MAG: hypothetical protein ACRDCB_10205, partial [Clostridium sp.]
MYLLDRDKKKISFIENTIDPAIERVLSTGDSTLSFSYLKVDRDYEKLKLERYIQINNEEYIIKNIDIQNDRAVFT